MLVEAAIFAQALVSGNLQFPFGFVSEAGPIASTFGLGK